MSDLHRCMALYRHCTRHLPGDAEALQGPQRCTITRFGDAANLRIFRVVSSFLGNLLFGQPPFWATSFLGNLSLALNDVGFYQLAKIMTSPTVGLLNFLFGITIFPSDPLSRCSACALASASFTATVVLSNPSRTSVATVAFTVTALYRSGSGRRSRT